MLLQADGLQTKPRDIKMTNFKTDAMLISKFFAAVILINTSLSSCNSQTANNKMNNAELNNFCQSFAKAICTKDTATFYKLVDKETLTASMNEWTQGNKKVTQEDLFFPSFLFIVH